MEYDENYKLNIAQRTKANLVYLEKCKENGSEVFEATQLLNSLLGLVIIPQQEYKGCFYDNDDTKVLKEILSVAIDRGNENPKGRANPTTYEYKSLEETIEHMRNALAHGCIRFFSDENGLLSEIELTDFWPRKHKETFYMLFTLTDLRETVDRLLDIYISISKKRL